MSEFINDDLLSALEVYYAKVEDLRTTILFIVEIFFFVRKLIKGWECQDRLGKFSLCDISTTGLPQEDADRYYSS